MKDLIDAISEWALENEHECPTKVILDLKELVNNSWSRFDSGRVQMIITNFIIKNYKRCFYNVENDKITGLSHVQDNISVSDCNCIEREPFKALTELTMECVDDECTQVSILTKNEITPSVQAIEFLYKIR